jgi:hypothetical protein
LCAKISPYKYGYSENTVVQRFLNPVMKCKEHTSYTMK